jgi:hypothetical protein
MRGHPYSGSVGVGETAYAPFLRIKLNRNPTPDVRLYSLESEDDDRRYLTALAGDSPDNPPFLQADASSPGTRWTMHGTDPGPIWLRAADLGGLTEGGLTLSPQSRANRLVLAPCNPHHWTRHSAPAPSDARSNPVEAKRRARPVRVAVAPVETADRSRSDLSRGFGICSWLGGIDGAVVAC